MEHTSASASESMDAIAGRESALDGSVLYGVTTTGIYCRPSCPSRRPKPENIRLFNSPDLAEAAGFRACKRCKPREIAPAAALVEKVTRLLDGDPGRQFTLEELGAEIGVSPFHLQRTFRKATGVTPKAYMSERRIKRFGERLAADGTVTDAIYDSGYNANSRAYDQTGGTLGMKPSQRKKRAPGVALKFAIAPTEFGMLLVATTRRGVAAVRLGENADKLETDFRKDFELAEISRDDGELANVIDQILVLIGSSGPHPQIPVDVQATAFQRRVWEYLQRIPRGETRSYSQVAADLGAPLATRAVANACARNEVALIVPCHRVVGANGKLTGFRWGIETKRRLLEKERT